MTTTDLLGNPVTLADAGSLNPLNDFIEGFMAYEARIVNVLQAAADPSPVVQAACAALHLFAESPQGVLNARPFVEQALASIAGSSPREARFVRAVAAWADGDVARAITLHEEQAREFPRDLVSLKLGQYHAFNLGDSPAMLRLGLAAHHAAADVPYFHGMLAFAYEQCHLLRDAERCARRAIAMRRKEPWAHHALAHVMLTEGRLQEGLESMRGYSDSWTGLNSFMLTHNWWHTAVFALELGDADETLRLYDKQVWGVVKDYSQDQVNAVSLLARLELAGVDVGNRWQDLADYLAPRTHDQVQPFLDLHYLYGLGRADRSEADTLLAAITAYAAQQAPGTPAQAIWLGVCLPAAQGLQAHARGEWSRAVEGLGEALPRLVEIGGSHAQRGLFAQIHLDALLRSGRLSAAQNLLQPAVNQYPESRRLRAQADALYPRLGLA